jgi:hypothetical protein
MLVILAGIVLAVLWSRDPSGQALRRFIVERPAELLSRLTVGRVVFALALLAGVLALFYLFGRDAGALAASGVGEAVSWFVAFDVGTYLDVLAVVWLLGASRQLRAAITQVRRLAIQAFAVLRQARPGRARPRSLRGPRRRRQGPRDDDPAPWRGPALIAAA